VRSGWPINPAYIGKAANADETSIVRVVGSTTLMAACFSDATYTAWARVAPKGKVSRPRLRDGDEAVERHRDVPQAFLAAVWARGRRS